MISTELIVSSRGDVTVSMVDELLSATHSAIPDTTLPYSTWCLGNIAHAPFYNTVAGCHQAAYATTTHRLDYEYTVEDYRLSRQTYVEDVLGVLIDACDCDLDMVSMVCQRAVIQFAALTALLNPHDSASVCGIRQAHHPFYNEVMHYEQLIQQPLQLYLAKEQQQQLVDEQTYGVSTDTPTINCGSYRYSLIKYFLVDYLPELAQVVGCGSGVVSAISIFDERTIFNNAVLLHLKEWLQSPFESVIDRVWVNGSYYSASDYRQTLLNIKDMRDDFAKMLFIHRNVDTLSWVDFIKAILNYHGRDVKLICVILSRTVGESEE